MINIQLAVGPSGTSGEITFFFYSRADAQEDPFNPTGNINAIAYNQPQFAATNWYNNNTLAVTCSGTVFLDSTIIQSANDTDRSFGISVFARNWSTILNSNGYVIPTSSFSMQRIA